MTEQKCKHLRKMKIYALIKDKQNLIMSQLEGYQQPPCENLA